MELLLRLVSRASLVSRDEAFASAGNGGGVVDGSLGGIGGGDGCERIGAFLISFVIEEVTDLLSEGSR